MSNPNLFGVPSLSRRQSWKSPHPDARTYPEVSRGNSCLDCQSLSCFAEGTGLPDIKRVRTIFLPIKLDIKDYWCCTCVLEIMQIDHGKPYTLIAKCNLHEHSHACARIRFSYSKIAKLKSILRFSSSNISEPKGKRHDRHCEIYPTWALMTQV